MPNITIQNEELYYTIHPGTSAAPPLVLIHGAGGTHLHWPPQLRRNTPHTVYALDLPGHGRSKGQGRTRIEDYRDVILAWADAIGLGKFVIAGHSMGGAIAQELALTHPERLAGLVLVATGARLRVHPRILQGLQENPEDTVRVIAEWAYGENPEPDMLHLYVQRMLEIPPSITYGDFAACNLWDRMQDVHRIPHPTLIIAGEADKLTPLKYLQYLADQIPNARLVIVPRAGHMVMLEAPDIVTAEIDAFLRSLETPQ